VSARQVLTIAHRWLGAALSVLFAVWFASGLVMVFARYPELDDGERLAAMPPLDGSAVRVAAAPAAGRAVERASLVMRGGRPAWRFAGAAPAVVYADDGAAAAALTADAAAAEIERRLGWTAHAVTAIAEADQWTLYPSMARQLPGWRVDDGRGTEAYLSAATGDLVQVTTRRERVLAWLGAIPHWIYPTALVRHRDVWRAVVIGASLLGALACLVGLVLGVWTWRRTGSPYAGRWLRWHHVLGLGFGLFACTWAFSGALSLTPLGWSPGDGPTAAERAALAGELDLAAFGGPAAAVRACTGDGEAPRELELVVLAGVAQYRCRWTPARSQLVVAATGARRGPFTVDEIVAAVRRGWPDRAIVGASARTEPDAYHHASRHGPPLAPYVRIALADGATLYVDPSSGRLLRRHVTLSRVERWLYGGLHSLDLPWLYQHRWLWHAVILVLLVAGLGLSATSVVITVQWLRRARALRAHRRARAAAPGRRAERKPRS
jgi:hypothetical protein